MANNYRFNGLYTSLKEKVDLNGDCLMTLFTEINNLTPKIKDFE